MNINSHEEARQALIAGFRIRNIRYSEDEWLEIKDELVTEDGYTHGSFSDEFWQLQLRLPERWHLVEKE